jgi:hypothetical protein
MQSMASPSGNVAFAKHTWVTSPSGSIVKRKATNARASRSRDGLFRAPSGVFFLQTLGHAVQGRYGGASARMVRLLAEKHELPR